MKLDRSILRITFIFLSLANNFNSLFAETIIFDKNEKIVVNKIEDNVWVITSYRNKISSNSLVINTKRKLIWLDTPWDEAQTIQLLKWCNKEFEKSPSLVICTHFHDDRVGGTNILKKKTKVKIIATPATVRLALSDGYDSIESMDLSDTLFNIDGIQMAVYYPGKGHTEDNIVVYLPETKILYGGCLIKSENANSLGYIRDAFINEWENSVENVSKKFVHTEIVIPGHGIVSSSKAIQNTIKLLRQKRTQ
jgi:metallo-beta-lactamase class B